MCVEISGHPTTCACSAKYCPEVVIIDVTRGADDYIVAVMISRSSGIASNKERCIRIKCCDV